MIRPRSPLFGGCKPLLHCNLGADLYVYYLITRAHLKKSPSAYARVFRAHPELEPEDFLACLASWRKRAER